jgi:predicted DCC family thiol-disulfide oxidoreductase YuxK
MASSAADRRDTPTLVFDGECGICRYWVVYWQGLTRGRIAFRPFQEAASDFPAIPAEAFSQSIQLIDIDGAVYAGAAAAFRVLRDAPGRAAWWWCYSRLPGFAFIAEGMYAWFARHRGVLNRLSKLLWGPVLLFRWLVFRFIFMSGIVKLLSGDPTWRGLTALSVR